MAIGLLYLFCETFAKMIFFKLYTRLIFINIITYGNYWASWFASQQCTYDVSDHRKYARYIVETQWTNNKYLHK